MLQRVDGFLQGADPVAQDRLLCEYLRVHFRGAQRKCPAKFSGGQAGECLEGSAEMAEIGKAGDLAGNAHILTVEGKADHSMADTDEVQIIYDTKSGIFPERRTKIILIVVQLAAQFFQTEGVGIIPLNIGQHRAGQIRIPIREDMAGVFWITHPIFVGSV